MFTPEIEGSVCSGKVGSLSSGKVGSVSPDFPVFGTIMVYTNDSLQHTRKELQGFYEDELKNCKITFVTTRTYPTRGTYRIFQTNYSKRDYPLFLETGSDRTVYDLFEKEGIVNKPASSLALTLSGPHGKTSLRLRHPDTEDDRFILIKFIWIFFGIAMLILLILPDSLWSSWDKPIK